MRTPSTLHLPAEDAGDRCLLLDGSVATVRAAALSDLPLMEAFFRGLSPESLHQRFFRAGQPSRRVIEPLCDSTRPDDALTLVAERTVARQPQFLGVASYVRVGDHAAEVAFAVGDAYRGKGIATALLERLLIGAARHGFRTLRATTLPDNLAMQDVFRRSGFQLAATATPDVVEIELAVTPSAAGVSASEERERRAAVASIQPLFEPRGIAVVGASARNAGIGRRVLDALIAGGVRTPVYPVHPRAAQVAGLQAYRSVEAIQRPVDLAVVAVPRDHVFDVIDDCARSSVRAVVVITAGFAEVGGAGRQLQQQLVERVRGYGMRMVGPNCMGILNTAPDFAVNASFSPVFPPRGGLALLSQSGALGIVILTLSLTRQVGVSSFVSVGNKADVSGNDLLQYWEHDEATRVIGLYLESFGNPRRFARIAARVSRRKPIIVVKAGRTAAGLRAASSHTAAMASRDVAVDALLRQTGAIRTDTIDELFDVAACLSAQPLPSGRRVAIVTNAGGPGILATDACELSGLEVVALGEDTRRRVAGKLPGVIAPGNPLDMIASAGADAYEGVVEVLLGAPEVDVVMILYTPVDRVSSGDIHRAIATGIARARRAGHRDTVVVTCLMAEAGFALKAGDEDIPVYAFPENAARALGKAADYAEYRRAPRGYTWSFDDLEPERARRVAAAVLGARGGGWLTAEETFVVLAAFGLHPTPSVLVKSTEDAVSVARVAGFPVVAKLAAADLVHKTEVGGVRTHLTNADDVRAAFVDLSGRASRHGLAFEGVRIQPMIVGAVETAVGVVRDPAFGPLIGFGLGGTEVELLADMRFGLAPLTDVDAAALIDGTRAGTLVRGYRGRPAADRDALIELLLRLSALATLVPEITELDFNPVMVRPAGRGMSLVDVRVKVAAVPDDASSRSGLSRPWLAAV